jgi:SAM-dependent methyltransferase
MANGINQRIPYKIISSDIDGALRELGNFLANTQYINALDIIDELLKKAPEYEIPLLVKAHEIYQAMPDHETRYSLYQSRHYNFHIPPNAKVLDIGSGHLPFPMATHLADAATEDHNFGRAGAPFKYIEGKPVYSCDVEVMPFADHEFDFIYCSHVLEHVNDPIKACKEMMRVAKNGYLETPNPSKDLFLNTAKASNHRWKVEYFNNRLVFTEYSTAELDGLNTNILMSMHCSPETDREKAFAAAILLKSDKINTMLMWETAFNVEVRRIDAPLEQYLPK